MVNMKEAIPFESAFFMTFIPNLQRSVYPWLKINLRLTVFDLFQQVIERKIGIQMGASGF